MYMNAMVTDKVIAGFNSRKAVLIISDRAQQIADGIMEVGRGVTFLHGQAPSRARNATSSSSSSSSRRSARSSSSRMPSTRTPS